MQKESWFFNESPKIQCGELNTDTHGEIVSFYESKYEISPFCRIIFDTVCRVDKTLLTLIAGSLTSLSVNLITDFMDLQNTISYTELIFRLIQFVFTCGFNIYVIRFTAKVIYIHESGEKYFPSEKVAEKYLEAARRNLMFYACMNYIKDLKKFRIIGGGCAVITLFSLLCKNICITGLNEAAIFLSGLVLL